MQTVIYLIKHAHRLSKMNKYKSSDSGDVRVEKQILSIMGEEQAKALSNLAVFDNVSVIYSSDYVSSIGTAKYLSDKLDIGINVDSRLGERITGKIDSIKRDVFYYNQYHDFDYKLPNGESINEVSKRMKKVIKEILIENSGNEIAIFTHEVAIISLLATYLTVGYNLDNDLVLTYNDDLSITSNLATPEVLKITFNDSIFESIDRIGGLNE